MAIHYCDTCSTRLTQAQIDEGAYARTSPSTVRCIRCVRGSAAQSVPTAPQDNPAVRQTVILKRAKSDRNVVRPSAAKPAAQVVPPEPSKFPLIPVLAGVVLLLAGFVGFLLTRSPAPTPVNANATPEPAAMQAPAPPKVADPDPAKPEPRKATEPAQVNAPVEKELGAPAQPAVAATTTEKPVAEKPVETVVATPDPSLGTEVIWIDDALPAGADPKVADNWKWVTEPVLSGKLSHTQGSGEGDSRQHYFEGASPFAIEERDTFFGYAFIDPKNPPLQIMFQFFVGNWEHRAYWGEDRLPFGAPGTPSRERMGNLPKAGEWVRLDVPIARVGVSQGQLTGWAFSQWGGTVYWDKAGVLKAPGNSVNMLTALTGTATPTQQISPFAPATPAAQQGALQKLLLKDFQGGGDFNSFGGGDVRPSKAIWGKQTDKHTLVGAFELAPGSYGAATLVVTSHRHGSPQGCSILIQLNGKDVFNGRDPATRGGKWDDISFPVPIGILKPGRNELRIMNTEDQNNMGKDPWYMINSVELKAGKTLNPKEEAASKAPNRTLEEEGILFSAAIASKLQGGVKAGRNANRVLYAGAGWNVKDYDFKALDKWSGKPAGKEMVSSAAGPGVLLADLPAVLETEKPEAVIIFGDVNPTRKLTQIERVDWEDVARMCFKMGAIPILVVPAPGGREETETVRLAMLRAISDNGIPSIQLKTPEISQGRVKQMLMLFDKHVFCRTGLESVETKKTEVE